MWKWSECEAMMATGWSKGLAIICDQRIVVKALKRVTFEILVVDF
jgi:hypothetical protein